MDDPCFIDGFGPLQVLRPTRAAEVGEIVRAAVASETVLYPVGGRTQLTLGQPPTRPGQAVDLGSLNRVIDFPARDMTITVEAGLTVANLRRLLAPENLRLPIDVPRAQEATIGGILAANVSGPRRLGYGTLRDYLIGVSAVNDDGNVFKAGGRVVKNVAGYDMCKLLVGSLGTLGIITQATFKLRPLAEEQALVVLPCAPSSHAGLLTELHGSRTRPVAIDLLNRPAVEALFGEAGLPPPSKPWAVLVGFEGNRDAVHWQVSQLVNEYGGDKAIEIYPGPAGEPLWQALTEFSAWRETQTTFKASILPSEIAAFCQTVNEAMPTTLLGAHAGSGIVLGHVPPGASKEQAAKMLGDWRELAGRGRVVVLRCPPDWKSALSVWGPIGGDAWLMREVKERFDAKGIFNPGRFYHGI